jgi:nicotinamide phosphoribosyltransferase
MRYFTRDHLAKRLAKLDPFFMAPLLTDSYKPTHWLQYPAGTTRVYSYFESRGGEFKETVFYGLQYFLLKYLTDMDLTEEKVRAAAEFWEAHFGTPDLFNIEGWLHIVHDHKGKLPLEIKAVPEGTVVPTGNVLMTIENTCDKCYWLTNYVETILVETWYPSTVATLSRECKKVIDFYLKKNGTPKPEVRDFKLHDFGFRGSTSPESAGLGGSAHLVNFLGTDTAPALLVAMMYYGASMPGYSIPAAEHSTITSWGRDREGDAYENMLVKFRTSPLVAVVSDSYNIYKACEELWGERLRAQIMGRNGTVVIRPDSGDDIPAVLKEVLRILGEKFGYSINEKGYKVLDPHVRIIQGDGIDRHTLGEILAALDEAGWSTDNIAFGSGGGLLQKVNRDTSKYAFKCSLALVAGEWIEVYKDPITDHGKRSKRGRMKLVKRIGHYETIPDDPEMVDELIPVYRDGEVLHLQTFAEIRRRAAIG